MQKYLWIAIGGSLGSLARYGVGTFVAGRMGTKFPHGMFVINLTACVIIGFSLALLGRRTEMNPAWRFLYFEGFVGAYSTFSTFEWGNLLGFAGGRIFYCRFVCRVKHLPRCGSGVWFGVMIARVVS